MQFRSVLLVYTTGLNNPGLFVGSFLLAVLLLFRMIPASRAYDSLAGRQKPVG